MKSFVKRMGPNSTITASASRRATRRRRRLGSLESLEVRQMLTTDCELVASPHPEAHGLLDFSSVATFRDDVDDQLDRQLRPTEHGHDLAGATVLPAAPASVATLAASSSLVIPALSSLPSATASIFLDFDGHFQATWGAYSNITTAVFDLDDDTTSLSSEEVEYIQDVWTIVAEDFAPFNINVTTVEPAALAAGASESAANGVALRLAIGGPSSALGLSSGIIGYAYINSFTSSIANVAYAFPENSNGTNASSLSIATTVSHEAGHSFGLRHVSGVYDISKRWQGIMNPSVFGFEDAYWLTATNELGTVQDDMAVLTSATNGFGYRVDDHGSTIPGASSLAFNGSVYSGSGIVGTNSDVDLWALPVVTGASFRVSLDGAALGQNLDAVLELLDANGQLLVTADPLDSIDASLFYDGSAAHYLRVRSNGMYGRIGQYSLTVEPSTSAQVIVNATDPLLTSESGASASATFVLTKRPTSDVILTLSSSNPSEGASPASPLVFTPSNWYVPQNGWVTAQNDPVVDGAVSYEINQQVTSTDPLYNAMPLSPLSAINADDDTMGWTKKFRAVGNGSDIYTTDVEVADDGSIVVVGSFSGTIDFDPSPSSFPLTSNYIANAYLAKYSATGDLIWAQSFGSTSGLTTTSDIVIDTTGNIYLAGYTSSTSLTIGSTTLTQSGSQSGILAKWNSSGQSVWAKNWGGAGTTTVYALEMDSSGNLVMAGDFTETVDFNPAAATFTRTSAGDSDGYITRFNSSGNFVSVNVFGGVAMEQVRSFALDSEGNTFVYGYFSSSTQLGSETLVSVGATDGFLIKMSASGTISWARQTAGDLASGITMRLARSVDGNLHWVGPFNGSMNFGPGTPTLTSIGPGDVLMSQWDASGNLLSTGQLSSSATITAGTLKADALGHLVLTGRFRAAADLAPSSTVAEYSPIESAADFILRLDDQAQIQNVFIMPTNSLSGVARDLDIDARGNLIVTNQFYDSTLTPTGDILTVGEGSFESYLMKLQLAPGVTVTPAGQQQTSELGAEATLSLVLDTPPSSDVTIQLETTDTSEGTLSTNTLLFTPNNWNVPQTIRVTGVDDSLVDGNIPYAIQLFLSSADSSYNQLTVPNIGLMNIDNDQPQVLFSDSFEVSEWNGLWIEDNQNDWFRSSQRATAGSYAAEVDGPATNATITMASGVNLADFQNPRLTFDWLIESGFDSGEYLALDVSKDGGATWLLDVQRLNGNVSPENVWQNASVDMTTFATSNVKIRFRSRVSAQDEDANVDNVRITGVPLGPNLLPIANAGGPYFVNEGGSLTLNALASSDPDGTITSYAWDFDNDGQLDDASGGQPAFSTTTSGERIVRLQVTDNRGGTAETAVSLAVANVAPTAEAGADQSVNVGATLTLSAILSSDPGNDIVSYEWDLDQDGEFDDATGAITSFTRSTPGVYTVSVRVTDLDGASSVDQSVINVLNLPTEVVLFSDSFEVSEWNGRWVEDAQNDWARSSQRGSDGSFSAEVDGLATNATLTLANSLNLTPYASSTLTFSWLIESGFDPGEFLSLDVSTNGGTTWTLDVRRLNGNASPENVWINEQVALSTATLALKIRFRSSVDGAAEDANVDNVRVVGVSTSAALSAADLVAANTTRLADESQKRRVKRANELRKAFSDWEALDGTVDLSSPPQLVEPSKWITEAIDQLFEWEA